MTCEMVKKVLTLLSNCRDQMVDGWVDGCMKQEQRRKAKGAQGTRHTS